MKCFLITLFATITFPNAVNALPFGRNLTLRNNIGEKFLIKGDEVFIENLTSKDLTKAINYSKLLTVKNNLEQKIDDYKGFLILYEEGSPLDIANNLSAFKSRNFYRDEIFKFKNQLKKYNKIINDIKKLQLDKANIHVVKLTYTPILINSKINKSVESKKTLFCINLNLKKEIKNIWYNYSSLRSIDKSQDKKICKKFAKFK